jgi:hypothetical protein
MLLKNSSFCTTHNSPISTGFAKQIMSVLRILCYNGSLVTGAVVSLTIVKYISDTQYQFVKSILLPIGGVLCGRRAESDCAVTHSTLVLSPCCLTCYPSCQNILFPFLACFSLRLLGMFMMYVPLSALINWCFDFIICRVWTLSLCLYCPDVLLFVLPLWYRKKSVFLAFPPSFVRTLTFFSILEARCLERVGLLWRISPQWMQRRG